MDLISIISTAILFTTIGTMAVAVGAYLAFKLRSKRKPGRGDPTAANQAFTPIFLTRAEPPPEPEAELGAEPLAPARVADLREG
jgi:hypothetical protein